MLKNSAFYKFINKINTVIVFVLLLLVSIAFDGAVLYGFNNSSFVVQEKYINKLKKEAGTDVHIRFSLGSETEASRLSLISPLNEYNAYRIKENGRAVSYVLKQDYDVTYEDKTFTSPYVIYDDAWNDNELISHNRFVLSSGSYKDLNKEDTVYISAGFLKKITGLKTEEAPGKKIKLSLDETKEFIIGGVIRDHVANESGLHFKSLFDNCFVLFNSPNVYKYGFTDLIYASNDDIFNEDFADFIKAYNKSYLSFDDVRLTISSYDEENGHKVGYSLSPNYHITSNDKTASFLSVLVIVLTLPIFLIFLLFYDFNKVKLYYKIPASLILTGYHFGITFYIVDKMKKGLFVSKLSLTMFIIFMIVSLLSYIFAFVLFNLNKKEQDEEKEEEDSNNG